MKTNLALFFILFFCIATQFAKIASGASKIPVSEIRAIACVVENKESGAQDEVDRMVFTGVGGLLLLDDKCKKTAEEHAKKKGFSEWRHLCCPITSDGKVHCESALGDHGRW